MFDNAGRVMFTALREAAVARFGATHPCCAALGLAAEAPSGEALAMAEDALRALPEADRLALFSAAHAALRSDPRAWLALWPGGPARQ